MNRKYSLSAQTRNNWLVDAALGGSAALAALSGVYFLYFPQGGYRGGRNALAQVQLLFERHTWDDLHTWGGAAMILVAAVHLALHWPWVVNMTRRTWKELTGRCGCLNARGRANLLINLAVALSFLLAAVSGVYFLFFPGGRAALDPGLLFPRSTWDLVHTWSGVALIAAALLHFAIHWKWVTKVTAGVIKPTFSI